MGRNRRQVKTARQEDRRHTRAQERTDPRAEPDDARVMPALGGSDQRHLLEVVFGEARPGPAAARIPTARRPGRSAPSCEQPAEHLGVVAELAGLIAAPGRRRPRRPARAGRGCWSRDRCRRRGPRDASMGWQRQPGRPPQLEHLLGVEDLVVGDEQLLDRLLVDLHLGSADAQRAPGGTFPRRSPCRSRRRPRCPGRDGVQVDQDLQVGQARQTEAGRSVTPAAPAAMTTALPRSAAARSPGSAAANGVKSVPVA